MVGANEFLARFFTHQLPSGQGWQRYLFHAGLFFRAADGEALRNRLCARVKRPPGSARSVLRAFKQTGVPTHFSQFDQKMDSFNEKYGTGTPVRGRACFCFLVGRRFRPRDDPPP